MTYLDFDPNTVLESLHSHDVSIIWNFWPLTWVIPLPIAIVLNIIFWPLTLLLWWTWTIWNFVTLIPQIVIGGVLLVVMVLLLGLFLLVTFPIWGPIAGIIGIIYAIYYIFSLVVAVGDNVSTSA